VSRDAVAQVWIPFNDAMIFNLTLQPGESTKTVQMPAAGSFTRFIIQFNSAEYVCSWPTTAEIQNRIKSFGNADQLLQKQQELESFLTATGPDAPRVLSHLMGHPDNTNWGARPFIQFSDPRNVPAGPVSFGSRCLNIADARTAIKAILTIIAQYQNLLKVIEGDAAVAAATKPAATNPTTINPTTIKEQGPPALPR
jgi:hypothetical protein